MITPLANPRTFAKTMVLPPVLRLSPQRARVLRAFVRESVRHPWPTIREICAIAYITSTSVVNYHIHALMDLGLLTTYTPKGLAHSWMPARCVGLTDLGEQWLQDHP